MSIRTKVLSFDKAIGLFDVGSLSLGGGGNQPLNTCPMDTCEIVLQNEIQFSIFWCFKNDVMVSKIPQQYVTAFPHVFVSIMCIGMSLSSAIAVSCFDHWVSCILPVRLWEPGHHTALPSTATVSVPFSPPILWLTDRWLGLDTQSSSRICSWQFDSPRRLSLLCGAARSAWASFWVRTTFFKLRFCWLSTISSSSARFSSRDSLLFLTCRNIKNGWHSVYWTHRCRPVQLFPPVLWCYSCRYSVGTADRLAALLLQLQILQQSNWTCDLILQIHSKMHFCFPDSYLSIIYLCA